MGRYRIVVPLLALAASCGSPVAYFKPAEQVHMQPHGRPTVAMYEMQASDGSAGATRLYRRGIFEAKGHTIAHVAVELESDGNAGMTLDVASLRVTAKAGDEVEATKPVGTSGPTSIPARGFGKVDAFFELPQGTNPKSITSFEVSWQAELGDQRTGEVTPFVRTARKGSRSSFFHGAFIPGTNIESPWSTVFSCPDDPVVYLTPPDC